MADETTATASGETVDVGQQGDESATEQLVVMRLASEDYGIDITHVREIIRMQNITEVPQAPAFVEGIINLRGSVIPVVDLRKRFGVEASEQSEETRIVVVDVRQHTVGLVVDGVTEVITAPEKSIEPVGNLAAASMTSELRGIVNLPEKLIILINMESLLGGIAAGDLEDTVLAA